ncbi:MAG: hypothetical protein PHV39_02915 [Methanomicrobium sp.]|nr:hypothetical protein [Methanomicrobium sp.]
MATDGETITISLDTRMKLARLRKNGQSYDSLISNMADQALETSEDDKNWDVKKIVADCKAADKSTKKYHSFDEVFGDV